MTGSRSLIDAQRADIAELVAWDIDLTTARSTPTLIQLTGFGSISADPVAYDSAGSVTPSTTLYAGVAFLRIGRASNAPIRLEGGSFVRVPAGTQVWLQNAAQSSRMLRLYFCPPPYEIKFYLKPDAAPVVSPASNFAVSVPNAATLISAAQPGRRSISIKNNDATLILYVGFTSGVTTANGMPVAAGGFLSLNDDTASVYGIASAAGPIDVRVITEG
jgi:hypothetical protein